MSGQEDRVKVATFTTIANRPDAAHFGVGKCTITGTGVTYESDGVSWSVHKTPELLWSTKPTAAEFGKGNAWFSDIGSMGYSNGTTWLSGAGSDIRHSPVQEAITAPAGADSGVAGVLNGTYTYMCTFVTADGETEGRVQSSNVTVTNKKINLTAIPVSTDSRVIARNIYRKPASASADVVPLNFLVQIADNTTTTYQDNIADASLGALVNRINTTGGRIYHNSDLIFTADTTNTSIGWDSGYTGTAYASTAVGVHTLSSNIGQRNVAVGMYGLFANTTGNNNTAVGVHALNNNVTSDDNVAVGYHALTLSTAAQNTAVGSAALQTNSTGTKNVALGFQALSTADTVNDNTAVGYQALKLATVGNNVAVGSGALSNLGASGTNVAVGRLAGATITAGTAATGILSCTLIGDNCHTAGATDSNSIVIGRSAEGQGSNTVVLGHTTIVNTYLRGGINLNKTVTAAGTTGAQTINNPTGTVNFAASATSLVVTNSLVTANSIIQLTVGTNDTTMKSAVAVAAAGSFTIFPSAAPTAETRVNFTVTN